MNAYTSISQSITLGKFLPLESADMHYFLDPTPAGNIYHLVVQQIAFGVRTRELEYDKGDISCWSLAALFDTLPKNLNIGRPSLESNYEGYYWIQYYDEFMKPNNYKTKCYDNPINACYEMILKLHELNLL